VKDELNALGIHCDELLVASKNSIVKSEKNLSDSKEFLEAKMKSWLNEYVNKFQDLIKICTKSKEDIENVLSLTKNQIDYIDKIADEKDKTQLVKKINSIQERSSKILEEQRILKVPAVVKPDEIENDLVPNFNSKRYVIQILHY